MIGRNIRHLSPELIKLPASYKPSPERLSEMEDSIRRQGILHNPCIKDNNEIIAGKLRVLAARNVKFATLACNSYPSNLSEDEYLEISLEENLRRDNLPWHELVIKTKEYHELKLRQNESSGVKGKKSQWGMRETAAELRVSLGNLSEDIKLADAIMLDPSLRRITDKTTAKKVIAENIQRSRQELGASRPVNIETNICHPGDAGVILKLYEDNTFDACITDPPWLEFRDPKLTRDKFTLPVFSEIYRTLKANSLLFAFVSTQDFFYYYEELPKIGFSVQKWPIIWVKEGSLSHGRKTWEYQRDYEPILVAAKGNPALTGGFLSSIISCKVVPSMNLIHPNEKPSEVMKRLIDHCSYEGSIILDPFAGSGSVLKAARDTNRRFVGIEKEPKYFVKILERLK